MDALQQLKIPACSYLLPGIFLCPSSIPFLAVLVLCVIVAYCYLLNSRVLYPQMRLRRQQSAQGVCPMKKVVLSASDVAVPDAKIVSSGFYQRSIVHGLPASPPFTPPVLAELLRLRHTTVTSPLSAPKSFAICCPSAFSSSSSSSPSSMSLSR